MFGWWVILMFCSGWLCRVSMVFVWMWWSVVSLVVVVV